MCTCHEVASNLPQGFVPQNYAILWFAYLLPLHYLVALHSALSLNSGIVTLTGKQTWKSFNRQNGFRTTLERLSCHKDFKITQVQTKVSFFYLNPLLQVDFRTIFESFSYILSNGSKRHANNVWAVCASTGEELI